MTKLALFGLAIVAVMAMALASEASFQKWMNLHGKQYSTVQEYSTRLANFQVRFVQSA
jgi:hypothetical protein